VPLEDVSLERGRFLTTRELAQVIGVKPNTLCVWRCRGTGPPFIKSDSIDQAMQQVRIAKAAEAREDLEVIAKMVRHHHPELSEAQVVSKALDAHPELYDEMVS
jgi:hypothetical protein